MNFNPIRSRLLEAARSKLSESVTPICNKEILFIPIDVTSPPAPITVAVDEPEIYEYEYIPDPDEGMEWEAIAS